MSKIFDYQDVSSKDMLEVERRARNIGDIWSNSAKCLVCGEIVRSKNLHHYAECMCGGLAVDGGSWYLKRNFISGNYIEKIELYNDAKKEGE